MIIICNCSAKKVKRLDFGAEIRELNLPEKKKDELRKKDFQFVILDESHMIKDSKSGRSQAVEPLAKNSRYLVLLSGTPALSRPIELYSQVRNHINLILIARIWHLRFLHQS